MVKLIVGLGNPGLQYEKTRHNVGFLFLDYLLAKFGGVWRAESGLDGVVALCSVGSNKLLLLKPSTFMNKSGQSVGKVSRYYKIDPAEILVVHDELDFEVGVVRLKYDGGHSGHNGVRDIIAHLNSKEFYRLRIGIGRPSPGASVADYVLSSFSKNEVPLIYGGFDFVDMHIINIVSGNAASVMNSLNSDGSKSRIK